MKPDFLPENPTELPRGEVCEPGLVVVDKPRGLTSNAVLSRVRRLAGQRKVGYAGTLDPLATGVLICAIGKATRLLQYLSAHDKTYLARVCFGISTQTDDAEGEVVSAPGAAGLTTSQIADALCRYRGVIQQVPSTFSAVKIRGKRAYNLARNGEEVALAPREVTISRLEILGRPSEYLPHSAEPGVPSSLQVVQTDLEVDCSAGTYIRALARDLGRDLKTGAHLQALRRVRVGQYDISEAKSLGELARQVESEGKLRVQSLDAALVAMFAQLPVDDAKARSLSYGQAVVLDDSLPFSAAKSDNGDGKKENLLAATAADGKVIALVSAEGASASPRWVLRPANETHR